MNTNLEKKKSSMKKFSTILKVGLKLKPELDKSQKQPHSLKWSQDMKRLKRIEIQELTKFNIGQMCTQDTPGSLEKELASIWFQLIEMFLSPPMKHITRLSTQRKKSIGTGMSWKFLRDLMSLHSTEMNQKLDTRTNTHYFTERRQRHDTTQPLKKMLESNMRLATELKKRQNIIQSIT